MAEYNYGKFTLVSEKELTTGPVFLIVIGGNCQFYWFPGVLWCLQGELLHGHYGMFLHPLL